MIDNYPTGPCLRKIALRGVLVLGVLASRSVHAQASVAMGFESSSGRYGGTSTTDLLIVPLSVRFDRGPWAVRLGTSWLSLTGDRSVVPVLASETGPASASSASRNSAAGSTGSGAVVNPALAGATLKRTTETGLGDVVLSVIRRVHDDSSAGLSVDVTGRFKFGTASADRGLGSGYNDHSLKADVYQRWRSFDGFSTLGFKRLGRADDDYLRPVLFGALGAGYRLNSQLSLGGALDAATAARAGAPGPVEASVFVRYRHADTVRLNLEFARGLNAAAADRAMALTLTWFLD